MKTEDERSVTVDRKIPINGSTFDQLFTTTNRNTFKPNNRVTVVGASDVGMATVFSLLAKVGGYSYYVLVLPNYLSIVNYLSRVFIRKILL